MLKLPKSSELKTHNAKVRFLVKLTTYTNSLETRIEQLEKNVKQQKKQLKQQQEQLEVKTSSLGNRISQFLTKKAKDVAPPEKTETEKEPENEE